MKTDVQSIDSIIALTLCTRQIGRLQLHLCFPPMSENVLLINAVRYVKLEACIVHDERLTWWDAVSLDSLIHHLPFMSHSCFTLMPPSVSCLCVGVPGRLVSRSPICHHRPGGDRAKEFGTWLLQNRKTDAPPMTNDNLRINPREREWKGKRAESLFHQLLLVLSLTSRPLFLCLSLYSTHFIPHTSVW